MIFSCAILAYTGKGTERERGSEKRRVKWRKRKK
jgi:hypothetical protein